MKASKPVSTTSETSQVLTKRAFRPWEDRVFGGNSLTGGVRLILYILIIGLVVGLVFVVMLNR